MAEFSLKELGKIILHIPGLIILIVLIVIFVFIFLKEPVSAAQEDADLIALRMEDFLEKPGDFVTIPITLVSRWEDFILTAEKEGKKGPFVEVYVHTIARPYFSGEVEFEVENFGSKKLDFPICPKNKIYKNPCVEGFQAVSVSRLEDKIFYSETSGEIFQDIKRRKEVETLLKAIRLSVSDSGRILLTAP